jgi:hypothetical protein
MSHSIPRSTAQLRATLRAEGLGARGIERAARNPDCLRLQALALAAVTPATAARMVYGETVEQGYSPLALAAGRKFESFLFANNGRELVALYVRAGRLAANTDAASSVCDLHQRVPGQSDEALRARHRLTLELVQRRLAGDRSAPTVLLRPRLSMSVLDRAHDIEPDALVADPSGSHYRVVEIKAYPDREGKTSSVDLRGACRQAAVGVVALGQALRALGARDPSETAWCDLILSVPGPLAASLRPMPIPSEVESIERWLTRAPETFDRVTTLIDPGASLREAATLDAIPNCLRAQCREHCALSDRCTRAAVEAADPVLLGDRAREQLLPAGSLTRSLRLLRGQAEPANDDEAALARRLQTAFDSMRRVVNDG